jgi:hypothetical protein
MPEKPIMLYRSQARAMVKEALTRFEQRLNYYEDLENGKYPGYRASEQARQLARHRPELHVILPNGTIDQMWNTIDDDKLSDLVCKCVILGHYYGLPISGAPDLSGVSGNRSPFEIYGSEPETPDDFKNMHPEDQLVWLKRKVEEAIGTTEIPPTGDEGKDYGPGAGTTAADLRDRLSEMKLDRLFLLDMPFMNITLRLFLNLSKNGREDYTWNEVSGEESEWKEALSIGALMHQTEAMSSQVVIDRMYNHKEGTTEENRVYNRLNAKFTHMDGREVVFKYAAAKDGTLITSYPDKGTFNYYPGKNNPDIVVNSIPGGKHYEYDMAPYTDLMKNIELKTGSGKCNIGLTVNSYYWQYDRDID